MYHINVYTLYLFGGGTGQGGSVGVRRGLPRREAN